MHTAGGAKNVEFVRQFVHHALERHKVWENDFAQKVLELRSGVDIVVEYVMGLLQHGKFDPYWQRGVGTGTTQNFKILSKLYFGRISAARGQRSKPI